jgi:predicted nucleic acid-binding protein
MISASRNKEGMPYLAFVLEVEAKMRDISDRPILRTAIAANVDTIITGDKDFLKSGIEHPRIVTASEFVREWKENERPL